MTDETNTPETSAEQERPVDLDGVNEAREAYYKKTHSLASAAALFLDDYSQGIEEMVSKEAEYDPRIREHWTEFQSLYWSYLQKQEEFLRAVANSTRGALDS